MKLGVNAGCAVKCDSMERERIDKLLVERGLAPSRTKAQAMIMAGAALGEEQRVEKPSDLLSPEAPGRIKGANDPANPYVRRGGVKPEAALREVPIDGNGRLCLDI